MFSPEHFDCSIAVNGGVNLPQRFNYFMASDHLAPNRSWFNRDNAEVRLIAAGIATFDNFLYPAETFSPKSFTREILPYQFQRTRDLPQPAYPHQLFYELPPNRYRNRFPERDQFTGLYAGATISGFAVQIAYLLGAAELHLFGCSFGSVRNDNGVRHYFYSAPRNQCGRILERHRRTMNQYLSILRLNGVEVVAHGPTALAEIDRQM